MPDDDKYLLKADTGAVNAIVDKILDEHAQDKAAHIARRVTRDEVVIAKALGLYEAVTKHPITGELHRRHASNIMGILNHCSQDGLAQLAQPNEIHGPMVNARACLMRLARILLKKQGVQMAQGW